MSERSGEARLLLRGLRVVSEIGKSERPISFRQIQEATNLAKATLSRILAALREDGYVSLDSSGKAYVLGPGMLDILSISQERVSDRSFNKAELQRLADELERSIWFWQVEGTTIRQVEHFLPFNLAPVSEGSGKIAKRLDRSAAGIAVLSTMETGKLTSTLSRFSETEHPATEGVSLLLGFAAATGFVTRSSGTGVSTGTTAAQPATELAAAITDLEGVPWAAISTSCPVAEVSDTECYQIGRKLAFAASQMSTGPTIGPRKKDVGQRVLRRSDVAGKEVAIEVLNPDTFDMVGSSPCWDADQDRLVWIDSLGGAINWRSLGSHSRTDGPPRGSPAGRLPYDELPGAITPYSDGNAIVASREGICLIDYQRNKRSVLSHPEKDEALRKFSTAKVGPEGRLWVGTLTPLPVEGFRQGIVYTLARDGVVTKVLNLERGPKGLCWSPDGSHLFVTQAGSKTILRFEVDEDTGLPVHPRRFARHTGEGTPNGLEIDREGCVWAAIYGGWQIARYDPQGRLLQQIDLPVPLPTGLCFCGQNRQDLFVTTCRLHVPPEVLLDASSSGAGLLISTETAGLPEHKFRI
ncbi:SMP-30/gluconolactonase/LRE family protein [Roseibium sp. HPY-6]|uniref:SMP-30/gluconolactonase/LRE family protein n=1 Tax=Roseibium sp. HPY-6 TaxID=3229852 RepID=UPI00338EABE2